MSYSRHPRDKYRNESSESYRNSHRDDFPTAPRKLAYQNARAAREFGYRYPRSHYSNGTPDSYHRSRPEDRNVGALKRSSHEDETDTKVRTNPSTHSSPSLCGESEQPVKNATTYRVEPYREQRHFSANFKITPSVDQKKSYKIVYDPDLSKDKKEGKVPKYKKREVDIAASDPRARAEHSVHRHKNLKKSLLHDLKHTRFVHDKNSLGPLPPNELVLSGFPISTGESLIKNNLKSYGKIEEFSMVVDPSTGAPLGICKLKFSGSPDKSARVAEQAVKETDRKMKLNGATVRSYLNGEDNKALLEVMDVKLGQKRKQIQSNVQVPKGPKTSNDAVATNLSTSSKAEGKKLSLQYVGSPEVRALFNEPIKTDLSKSNPKSLITQKSITNYIRDLNSFSVPEDLQEYIRGRPFIFLALANAPISVSSMKRYLRTYDYTRIHAGKTGFYIVFRCLKYANECFRGEFGKDAVIVDDDNKRQACRFMMQLIVSADWEDRFTGTEIISDARKFLLDDLKAKLIKDVHDELNANIIDMLHIDNYPAAAAKLKELEKRNHEQKLKADTKKAPFKAERERSFINNTDIFSINGLSKLPKLPNIKKSSIERKRDKALKGNKTMSKFDILPMSHALNYSLEEDSKTATPEETPAPLSESDSEDDKRDEDDGEAKLAYLEAARPVNKMLKTELNEDEDEDDLARKNISSEPTTPEENAEVEHKPEGFRKLTGELAVEDLLYQPTTDVAAPVYPDTALTFSVKDLNQINVVIKDQEDWEILKDVFSTIEPTGAINNADYWAWRQRENIKRESLFRRFNELNGNVPEQEEEEELEPFFENETGSWRSEGFRKIPDSRKAAYLPHKRRLDAPLNTVEHGTDDQTQQSSSSNSNANNQSSRVNRANNRRLVADIKSISAETDLLELNALAKRKKPVSFARSAIHNWGLYALEPISAGEMIIEYVGDRIRQQVAELREKKYLKSGIGSSYLFRVDENTVIDATKKGGIARFINHCCSPSCTAKIIKVEGKKRIVIYALKDIAANEELTYDYKFEREINNDERIPCLCGAPGCKGYLN